MMQNNPEIWPGPMEGVSRPEFIRAVNSLNLVKRWMTPFIRVSDSCFKEKKVKEFLTPFLESELPVTAQIMGTNAAVLAELSKICINCGAVGINLNCGCPSKRVISGGAGGGALKNPEQLLKTAEVIRKAIDGTCPFSIKMRTGYATSDEMHQLIPQLVQTGIDKLFIHFRTVREQYLPVPERTERLKQAVELAKHVPVIVNGDINTAEDGRELLKQTGAAGVMIARAFLQDPWLPARFENEKTPDPETGRKIFFETLESFGVSGGNRLELCKMIFGAKSPQFQAMLNAGNTR